MHARIAAIDDILPQITAAFGRALDKINVAAAVGEVIERAKKCERIRLEEFS
jgi:hypothetical protein